MRQEGIAVAEIASELGVSTPAVYKVLKEYQVETPISKADEALADEAVAGYLSKERTASLLERLGISTTKLYKLLRARGIDPQEHKQGRKDKRLEKLEEAVQLYIAGVSIWQISQDTGVNVATLNKELHVRGVPLRRPRKAKEPEA